MAIPTINVSDLNGSNGFRLDGADVGYRGLSVRSAGDINGDGFDEVIIGAPDSVLAGEKSGSSYLVFGKPTAFDAIVDLSSLDGNNGFRLDGETKDISGISVSSAGDINGDGFDELLIGAPFAGPDYLRSGESYIVFGKALEFAATIELSNLDGNNGFILKGVREYDASGYSVSGAGDFNGDGLDDVIIGARSAEPTSPDPYHYNYGASYIVFGKTSGFDALTHLSDLDGNNGFRLDGPVYSRSGSSVSRAGDFNGDGFDDVIVNAPAAAPNGSDSGSSYIVFGKDTDFDATLDLTNLKGSDGFRVDGIAERDGMRSSVSAAGDINGNGFDDVVISMPGANLNGYDSGSAYILFGKAAGCTPVVDLLNLDGHNGFRVDGFEYDNLKSSGVGDINGDGYDDLVLSAHNGLDDSNTCYVLFGKAYGFSAAVNLMNLTGLTGFRIKGLAEATHSGLIANSAGDMNNDGFDDVIIGAVDDLSPSYVLFGSDVFNAEVILGSPAEDYLVGSPLAERFDAEAGNDFLIGSGGADIFQAGAGDDIIIVPDLGFQSIEGDTGNDTLVLRGDRTYLKLADYLDTIHGIETFNLSGHASILKLSLADLRELSDTATTFTIHGDSDDYVIGLNEDWEDKGIDGRYRLYANQDITLRIETKVSTDRAPVATFSLLSLNGLNGFRLDEVGSDGSMPVNNAGDVNGDGFDDVIIGSPAAGDDIDSGVSYVIFGKAAGFDKVLRPTDLDGSNGFRLEGRGNDQLGFSVSGGGDINGDGFDDVIVGAPHAFIHGHYNGRGVSYLIFGKASGFDATMNMSSLDGTNGFRLIGGELYDLSGYSVSIAGDVNGDGLDDLIIGAPMEFRGVGAGSSYIMFGRSSGFEAEIDLSGLDGSNGFRLNGINNHTGRSVSNAGDMNGDGFSDLMIGAQDSCYIVFGKASGFAAEVDLADLDGNNGFRLEQVATYDDLGRSVSGAGDINGDGFDDVIVGASGADPNGMESGSSYVIFGKASGFTATMDLSRLDGTNGFRLDGSNKYSLSGSSVSGAGDINGDGFDELLVGEPFSGANGNSSGANYIIFGKASGFSATLALADLDGRNGFRIDGLAAYDGLGGGSSAGDVNGDGFDDLIMSAAGADPNGINLGSSYVIFGSRDFGKKDLPEIVGTPGDDVLRGTTAPEIFEAGDGVDLLIGRGGADIFHGGAGSDHIKVPDLAFQNIDGGSGSDVLHLDGRDLNLDLAMHGDELTGIETIGIYGRGANTLSLTAEDVVALSDTTDTLKLHGNTDDRIAVLDQGWVDEGMTGFYHRYTNDEAILLVGANLAIDFVA